MKSFFRIFALIAIMLAGSMTKMIGKTLVYDFVTNHPSTTIRIDQGFKEVRNGKVYWGGTWAGLFGNKIAFDPASAYASLLGQGGLCDFHDHQKMYVMNLSAGDKVTFYYTGTNASLQFHISSTATMQTLKANFDPIASDSTYTVTGAGDLCVLNKFSLKTAETIINKIIIETAADSENIDLSTDLCTYCSNNPLDFSNVTTAKAYIATEYQDGKFIFKQVKYVPSHTGFLISRASGTSNTITVPIGRSSNYKDNTITGNLFIGCLKFTSIPINSEYNYYIFGKAYGYMAIYLMWWDFHCISKKAYIAVKK